MAELDDVKQAISGHLKSLFDLHRQRKQLQHEYAQKESELKAWFEPNDQQLAERMTIIANSLHGLITTNQTKLLTGTLKSFAMLYGKVAFKQKRATFKISNKSAVEELARKDRILTTVGRFERVWKPDAPALKAWLMQHPELAAKYEPYLERDGGYDEIFAQPNDAYLTQFDPNRLSNESIKLEPAKGDHQQDV